MPITLASVLRAALPAAVAALLVLTPTPAPCQQKGGAESLEQKLEKTLKEPFFQKAPWITDYDKAREESKKRGKPIFAYFTRSYAY
jgi:hypothetical protein